MSSSKKINNRSCLIICNGQISVKLLKHLLQSGNTSHKPIIISADGASNFLHKNNIVPDYIIGDLDSISASVLKYYRNKKVKIIKVNEQEHNDLEKCIHYALSKNIKYISVIGYGGKRIDHTLNNFSVLKRNYKKAQISFIDKRFETFFLNKKTEFNYNIGSGLSLMGMPKAGGIKTKGVQYPLNNETLEFGVREGALNKATDNTVMIEFSKGDLLIFKEHSAKT
jgi:thiamine pyrophosphokinase